jgi:carbon-monoxide dehydrogenase iron sulfur subunit
LKRISIKLDRCIGCKSCELACAREHSPVKGLGKLEARREKLLPRIKVEYGSVDTSNVNRSLGKRSRGKPYPIRCRHCAEPKCVSACMAGALVKLEDGTVRHLEEKCVGCWMCIMACPYGAISRDVEAKTIVKCDMCPDRMTPACVAACKSGAMFIQWEEVEVPRPTVEEVLEG